MCRKIPQKLLTLAKNCPAPLYIVGGFVRDALAGLECENSDLDLASPMRAEVFSELAKANGFSVSAVYRNTGTVKLSDGEGGDYEYTCFRSDKYVRGRHTPSEVFFTEDIRLDARRRDFIVNAVYYDIAADEYVDPLGGIDDIAKKRLRTVDAANKVFGEDGLRLMRLARQAGQTGFIPDADCLDGARKNASLIRDVSPERIFAELNAVLLADKKYGKTDGHYRALKILDETRVLDRIFPELTSGRYMPQRADFHSHDVLEHSLRAARYADPKIRLAALLHDAAKPLCKLRDGNMHNHPVDGAKLVNEYLLRLKAPNKLREKTVKLVLLHMYDLDGMTSENKLRRFFVKNANLIDELLLLKQADYSACKDDLSESPSNRKWRLLLEKMKTEGAPTSLKQLAVNGRELADFGIESKHLSLVLEALLLHCAVTPKDNEKERLIRLAHALLPELLERKNIPER